YEKAVSFFHFRWNFGKAVDEKFAQQISLLPPKYRFKALKTAGENPQLETLMSSQSFYETLHFVREDNELYSLFVSSNGVAVIVLDPEKKVFHKMISHYPCFKPKIVGV
ncbi:MAG: hypothetical protein Q7S74_00840, partial [Nanoarchaeota archaeon]|nr:hypothetical protein [Nanoarchaeota archaeon]